MLCDLPGVLSFLGLPPETEMPPGNKGKTKLKKLYVGVNIFFTIFTNAFSPIAPTRIRRIRQRGCAAFGV